MIPPFPPLPEKTTVNERDLNKQNIEQENKIWPMNELSADGGMVKICKISRISI